MTIKHSIGIDIGGTKISLGLIREDGSLVSRLSVKSQPETKESMYDCLTATIKQFIQDNQLSLTELAGFGIGIPGKVDAEKGLAVFQNNLPWQNFPIVSRLTESFPDVEKIVIENDVYQAAYAEWWASSLDKKEEILVYLTISTGIASAIVKDGKMVHGQGFAGELGLTLIPSKQYSGQLKRLEETASGPALAEIASSVYHRDISTKELFDLYQTNDPEALQIIKHFLEDVALSIYSIGCLLNPHKIILGGSVITNNAFLLPLIKRQIETLIIEAQETVLTSLEITTFVAEPGLIGAGLSVFNN